MQLHSVHAANELARGLVVAAGFEVFDPFATTLHAMPAWFDRGSSLAMDDAEAISDMTTQLLLNHICGPQPS